jgi:hypothetical protein
MPWGQRYTEAPQRLKFTTLDHTCFQSLLASNLDDIRNTAETEEELDNLVNRIISAVYSAYTTSTTRSLPQGGGKPWWNTKYKKALQDYRTGSRTQKDFQRVVKQAQQQYWRQKINTATISKEVFDISK